MGELAGSFAACGVLLFGVAGTVLNKIATRQKLERRKAIDAWKILGVSLGITLLSMGVQNLLDIEHIGLQVTLAPSFSALLKLWEGAG